MKFTFYGALYFSNKNNRPHFPRKATSYLGGNVCTKKFNAFKFFSIVLLNCRIGDQYCLTVQKYLTQDRKNSQISYLVSSQLEFE